MNGAGLGRSLYAFVIALILGSCTSGHLLKPGQTVRMLALNIQSCQGEHAHECLQEVADLVKTSRADVVALHGVNRPMGGSDRVDMITTLSDLTGMTYAFARTGELHGAETGLGLLTRFPIVEESRRRFVRESTGKEHGGYLQVVLESQGTEFVVMNAALGDSASSGSYLTSAAQSILALRIGLKQSLLLCISAEDPVADSALGILRRSLAEALPSLKTKQGSQAREEAQPAGGEHIFFSQEPDTTHSRYAGETFIQSSGQFLRFSSSFSRPLYVEFEVRRN